jgi:7-cyano-7-deazaguanine synthase
VKEKALVLLSGGLDSAVCLYLALKSCSSVVGLTFNYYDRREAEKNAAHRIAAAANIRLISLSLEFLREASDNDLQSASLLQAPPVYIPARNIVFYGIAAHYAERMQASRIYGGHIKADVEQFQDASKNFFDEMNAVLKRSMRDGSIQIYTPLIDLEKHEVLMLGSNIGVPFQLTWSCYENGPEPCGKCHACIERKQAFNKAKLVDPLM